MLRELIAATTLFIVFGAAIAQSEGRTDGKATSTDFAQCAATAARKAQVLKEAEEVLGKPVANIRETAALVPHYFRIGCSLSTVASTFDAFDKAQADYDAIVKRVAERCKYTQACLSDYLIDLDARLSQCSGFVESQKEIIQKLVPVAQPGCKINFEP